MLFSVLRIEQFFIDTDTAEGAQAIVEEDLQFQRERAGVAYTVMPLVIPEVETQVVPHA